MCFVVNKFLHLFQVLRNFQNTATAINAPPSPLQDAREQKNENVLFQALDYMQNISLPKIPVQELFYLRQLMVSVFSIHDVKRNVATLYLYHEGQARKSPK